MEEQQQQQQQALMLLLCSLHSAQPLLMSRGWQHCPFHLQLPTLHLLLVLVLAPPHQNHPKETEEQQAKRGQLLLEFEGQQLLLLQLQAQVHPMKSRRQGQSASLQTLLGRTLQQVKQELPLLLLSEQRFLHAAALAPVLAIVGRGLQKRKTALHCFLVLQQAS